MLGIITKKPADILIYTFDWSVWLNSGDSLNSSTWTVPAGLTNVASANTTTKATVKVSGGTTGTSYTLTNSITSTVSGETKTETFTLKLI